MDTEFPAIRHWLSDQGLMSSVLLILPWARLHGYLLVTIYWDIGIQLLRISRSGWQCPKGCGCPCLGFWGKGTLPRAICFTLSHPGWSRPVLANRVETQRFLMFSAQGEWPKQVEANSTYWTELSSVFQGSDDIFPSVTVPSCTSQD